ncbi:MAG: molybdopterin molybdotransferase MoeA [Flavobacteriaceae bacterium]|nr:molybdopterin molybdotransferase MoeA [Flavobacteriaceae bacterium]
MIEVEKALEIIQENTNFIGKKKRVMANEALRHVLSEDVFSKVDMPPFRQSAMDGYAVNVKANDYRVIGEVKAGDEATIEIKEGEAVRIFTGAAVPDTANAVVIQERVTRKGNVISLEDVPKLESNIRPKGEQIRKGEIALESGMKLNAAAIGYLNMLGVVEVSLVTKPVVKIITTGNELIKPGTELTSGKIYESNSAMLQSALNEIGEFDVELLKVEDDYSRTREMIEKALNNSDMLLVSGGISVGDYDFVGKALRDLGVKELFYKVNQKPGKPLFYGKKDEVSVFALPGNPASALTCFYVYVHKALQGQLGNNFKELKRVKLKSASHFLKRGTRAQFLKASVVGDSVMILEGQSSAMLKTYALANALVYVPSDLDKIEVDQEVEVILLPL